MTIDLFTLFAQLFNFFILVLVLNRFLFRPILKVVDARNIKIKKELEDASAQKEEARAEKEWLSKEHEAWQRERENLLSKATLSAEQEKTRLIKGAREEYELLRHSFQDQLQQDRQRVFSELEEKIKDGVLGLARKALEEMAHTSLEEQVAAVFIQKLSENGVEELKRLADDIARSSPHAVVLKSGFEFSPSTRLLLEKTLREVFGEDLICSFEKEPSVICGIELVTLSQKVGWNLSQYLDSLRATL